MGITVVLQNEHGGSLSDEVQDPKGLIYLSLPDHSDSRYVCLRFVDPYGDTIFNRLQAPVVLEEWEAVREVFLEHDAEGLWAQVRTLIARCGEEPHAYLRFVGD